MAAVRGKPIALNGNDDEPEAIATRKNATTGAEEALSGVTGLSFRIAAQKDGAAIHATLQKDATQRTGATKLWFCILEGSDIATHLVPYAGLDVYQVFGGAQDVNYNVVRRVIASRP